jgi:hypothetical protein
MCSLFKTKSCIIKMLMMIQAVQGQFRQSVKKGDGLAWGSNTDCDFDVNVVDIFERLAGENAYENFIIGGKTNIIANHRDYGSPKADGDTCLPNKVAFL